MYPTLYEALQDIFGIQWCFAKVIQSFGFFVAVAFLLCGWVFARELKRREQLSLLKARNVKVMRGKKPTLGQTAINLLVGFALGYKIFDLLFRSCELAENVRSYLFSAEGSLIGGLSGAALAWGLQYIEQRKEKYNKPTEVTEQIHPHQHVGNMTLLAALFGILGAKVFHILENPDEFSTTFDSVDAFFSGLTMYGGLIFGAIAVLWYAKRKGLTILHTMDSCAPGLMLAYGVGRVGCQVAGDGDWGIPNDAPKPGWLNWLPDWTWAYDYPNNVLGVNLKESYLYDGYQSLTGMAWPTPLYEAVACIGLFFLLWFIRKRITVPGVMFSIYLILNGVERFFIEKIRVNEVYHFLGMEVTQAEIISTLFMALGVGAILYLRKNREKVAHL